MQERPKISPKNVQPQSQAENLHTNETNYNDRTEENIVVHENALSSVTLDNFNKQQEKIIKPRPKLILKNDTNENTLINENTEINRMQSSLPKKRRLKFEDKYHRLSTFLENDLYDKVVEFKEQGYIDSIVQLVNDSIKLYLKQS